MNKIIKKISGILLISSIFFYSFPIYALTKDETVYAKLNNDGKVENIFVNEHLINNEKINELTDETELYDILNINGDETFKKEENKITWNTSGNDIYYQGKINKALPIEISIKYYLNDEEKSLEDILGKEGNIKIKMLFTNNDKHNIKVNGITEELYTPFLITTGLILKGETNRDVIVNNGKVINNGIDNIVVGLSTPGLYESLNIEELKDMDEITIEFTTTKFELPNIYSVVTPKIISEEDLKIFNKMNELYGSVNTLKTSIDEIESGAKSLSEGINKINTGTGLINENLQVVLDNLQSIKDGSKEINDGLNLVLNNLLTIKNTLTLPDGLDTLIQTNEQTATLYETTNPNLSSLLRQNNVALTEIQQLPLLLDQTIGLLENALKELEKGSAKIYNGTQALTEGVGILKEKTNELYLGTININEGSQTLTNGITKFNEEGITKIYNYVNYNLRNTQNKLEALVNLSKEYNSFSMNNKNSDSETKFILNIKGAKSEEKETKTKIQEKETTLWTRIKNLFK